MSKSGALTVQLNIGYGFLPPETWSVGAINNGKNHSDTVGANLGGSIGFNDGIYGFGGGINTSSHTSESIESLQDINGDGLLDRVIQSDGRILSVGINTGNGFAAPVAWPSGLSNDFARQVQETQGGGLYFTIKWMIAPNVYLIVNPGVDYARTLGRGEAVINDIDGDGYADHLKSTSDALITTSKNTHGRTNLLRSVSRPLLASFEVDYVRTGNSYQHPNNRWALSRVIINDGQPGDGQDLQVKTYAWEGGFFERRERLFYGFAKCTETQVDPVTNAPYRVVTRNYNNSTFYNKMLLAKERLSDAAGNPFTEVEHTYVVRDEVTGLPLVDPANLTAHAFAQKVRTDKRWFEGQTVAGKSTFETFEYDKYGNVSRYVDASEPAPTDDVEAQVTYHEDLTPYIVGKANLIRILGNGVVMRERQATFQAGTGNLLEVRKLLAGGTAAVTSITYDTFGNIATLTGPANHAGQRYALTYTYEPIANTHVASVTDSFGYASTAEYDLKWGQQTKSTDINSQIITTAFDTVGRPTSITGPYQQGSGQATITMEYHPGIPGTDGPGYFPWAKTRHLDEDRADTIDTVTFIDGLQRVTQTKKDLALHASADTATDVKVVSGRTKYDGFGRVIEQYYPVTEALGPDSVFNPSYDSVTPTTMVYDVLDRKTRVVNPANEATQFVYGFGPDRDGVQQFLTRVTDANGVPREIFRDVDDDITSVKLVNTGAQVLWTSYGYDPLDQITSVKDAKNNITRAEYDNFGRRTVIDSPDMGRTEYVFDLASNLHEKVTSNLRAAGTRITYNYDFNRIAAAVYPQFPQNNATYTYGAPGAQFNRAGRAFRITAESGTREMDFGPLGEVVKEVRTVNSDTGPDPVYTTQYRFDTWNRLQQLTYPDGEVLDFVYDSGGLVRRIAGAKGIDQYAYLNFMGYDKFEARVRVAYGNGTKTDYAYNPLHRRVTSLVGNTPANRNFMSLSYGYDPVGNILSLANGAPLPTPPLKGGPTAFTFTYDNLYQLKTATGQFRSPPDFTDRYTLAMGYDEIHNITSKNQLAGRVKNNGEIQPDNKITYNWAYDYGSGKPHAATHSFDCASDAHPQPRVAIARSLEPVLGRAQRDPWNLNGNQAGWDADRSGQRRRITWASELRARLRARMETSQ